MTYVSKFINLIQSTLGTLMEGNINMREACDYGSGRNIESVKSLVLVSKKIRRRNENGIP
ncbi:MAG: hypothetical protein LUQ00_00395 [Candidatus Methanomethyliaceae archaeon]|nr:hypothetical protein [Candidatus Methanomethyliaceae archaeon]